ncbi:UvrD-helicase domain-containing protein [Streptomyces sp. MAR4 CNX-425]|uniref:UvrD-helicase domain-containing protein n=1 Tax=Streptomyces sp. MAR4 CNX-425 TaxID=3406343 RepID=UPI003B51317D
MSTASVSSPAYRLVRTPPVRPAPPVPDARQRAVVDHGDGPLLVLAGPGTGKTTTLVEAVTERVRRGTDPERILVLTFSRRAAVELRDRMAARLAGAGARTPQASTFHSYCYALVRAHQDAEMFVEPLRLLSGPEQDVVVRELLAGHEEDGERARVSWPGELRAGLTTRGFADEVRAVLARSRELGLGAAALERFAAAAGRPDWAAAGEFLAEYLDVLDMQGVLDYAELVHRAVLLAETERVAAELAGRYDAVFVDEYQDTDAAQVRLLRALAGGGRTLVAFGDPDQSIYAFRGADVGGILTFPEVFPRRDGRPAPVAVLGTSRRSGAKLLAATRLLTRRMPLPRLPSAAVRAHRALASPRAGGRVEAYTYPTASGELDNVADILRRAHLEDGVPWREMAVLVRAGARTIPSVRRALTSAGVPLHITGDDLPLRHEPAAQPLLTALRVAATGALPGGRVTVTGATEGAAPDPGTGTGARGDAAVPGDGAATGRTPATGGRVGDPAPEAPPTGATEAAAPDPGTNPKERDSAPAPGGEQPPSASAPGTDPDPDTDPAPAPDSNPDPGTNPAPDPWITPDTALTLLSSPLGGMDAADLRRLGRALREEERGAGRAVPRPSDVLLAEALAEPERLVAHDRAYAAGALRLGRLLRTARDTLTRGGTAEAALWELWHHTPWPDRLQRAAARGGPAGRNADRDLDAVCALFEAAARAEDRTGGRGALNFLAELEAQDIAADLLTRRADAAPGGPAGPDAVRLMTAHRAKGLEWRLVVVAQVQEGLWPDLRRRGSLLEADRIGRDGLAEPLPPGAILAEERRLFYVAATRARERLVVTAVKAPAEDGDQPSRFLGELGVDPKDVTGRPRRPLSVAAMVAELRATTVDPEASDALRAAAAERLARLAAPADDGRPLAPAADPERWWGLDDPTENTVPLRDRDLPVALSGSAVGQLVDTCALQWFLGREVRAGEPASAAQGFGLVVHALADEVASGRTPADLDALMERLDGVWDGLAFDAPWKSAQEKGHARAALERFLRWHVLERGRRPVASERDFDVTLKAGTYEVQIKGTMDRVEEDDEGRAYVVDFKTGKSRPTGPEVAEHAQLAVYQAAVAEGAAGAERTVPGGAELVHLRIGAPVREGGDALPKVQRQPPPEGDWVPRLLATAAARVLDERFGPTPGDHCAQCAFRSSCSARPEGRHVVE